MSKELKNGIGILVGQANIVQNKILTVLIIDPQLKNRLSYENCKVIFEFLGQFTLKDVILFFKKKSIDNFEIAQKTNKQTTKTC